MATKRCVVEGCDNTHRARGYCLRHCQSLRINEVPCDGWSITPLAERFWARVDKRGPTECWPWSGMPNADGYGVIGRGRREDGKSPAHRVSYELSIGPIPGGAQVDHTCHNDTDCKGGSECQHRRCCNPAHLEAVTQQTNISRGNAGKYQTVKTHCPQGHEYTPENTFRNNGGRGCKECRLAWNRKYNLKRKAA